VKIADDADWIVTTSDDATGETLPRPTISERTLAVWVTVVVYPMMMEVEVVIAAQKLIW
jgi:hypothetical protein